MRKRSNSQKTHTKIYVLSPHIHPITSSPITSSPNPTLKKTAKHKVTHKKKTPLSTTIMISILLKANNLYAAICFVSFQTKWQELEDTSWVRVSHSALSSLSSKWTAHRHIDTDTTRSHKYTEQTAPKMRMNYVSIKSSRTLLTQTHTHIPQGR